MTLDELQKALKNRPLEHVDFEGLTIDNIVRTRDQRKAVLKQLQDWQEWFETFEKLFSVFKAEYDVPQEERFRRLDDER